MTNRKKKGMQQVEKRCQAESCSGASATSRGESSKKNSAPEVHPQAKVGQGSSLVLMRTPSMTLPLIQLRKPSAFWLRAYKAGKQGQDKKELSALQKEKSVKFISLCSLEASSFCHALDILTHCYLSLCWKKTLQGTVFSEYVLGCSQHSFL